MLVQCLVVADQIVLSGVLVWLLDVCGDNLLIVSGWTSLVLDFLNCVQLL
jgi:hypothetical protein